MTSIVIPNSVTSIGSWAFVNCDNLTIYCEATSKPSGWADVWTIGGQVHWGFVGFATDSQGVDYIVSKNGSTVLSYNGSQASVIIPDNISEANSINLSAKLSNQLGNAVGLENETVSWSLKEDYQGVSIVDNKLLVNGSAYAGTIALVATCAPGFSDIQTVEEFPVTLVTADGASLRPRADNVTVSGIVEAYGTLIADYDFYQVNQEPSIGTVTQWQIGNSLEGPFTDITGETGMTLTVDPTWVNSYIRFAVTPATATHTGDTSYSRVLLKPTAPIATSIKISGTGAIGNIFTGS